jgi:hypothetical protein
MSAPEICPDCKRTTRLPHLTLAQHPGTIRRVSDEGHCSTCWNLARARRLRGRDPQEIALPLDPAIGRLKGYIDARRRRGVPAGGVHFDGDPAQVVPQQRRREAL